MELEAYNNKAMVIIFQRNSIKFKETNVVQQE